MNAKAKQNKARKRLEAQIVKETSSEAPEGLNNIFIYDKLNTHKAQADTWGEEKNGLPYSAEDFELLLRDDGYTATKRLGERIVGKLYQLTDDQLDATEGFYDGLKKKVINDDVVIFVEE